MTNDFILQQKKYIKEFMEKNNEKNIDKWKKILNRPL